MSFNFDHDYHIHSKISSCSNDPEQTCERILQYANENGLKKICLTDHYWDSAVPGASNWYQPQNYEHIAAAKPLPSAEGIEFLFGCETDIDKLFTLGITKERFDDFDLVLIPTTHLHMHGFTISEEDINSNQRRAELWVERFEKLLDMDLPFHKVGIAHLTCILLNKKTREDFLDTLSRISDDDMKRLFKKAASLGCGIELNQYDMAFKDSEEDVVLRPYKIAKECGCKFYFGSDAHHPGDFKHAKERFEKAAMLLGLTEDDKFII